jgi:hypothetical protein
MLVPPYGSEKAGLETIFDVKHLKKKANFLDTQCNQSFPSRLRFSYFFPLRPPSHTPRKFYLGEGV